MAGEETIRIPFNIDTSRLSAEGQTWASEKIEAFKAQGFTDARMDSYVLSMEDETKGDYAGKFPIDKDTETVSEVFVEKDNMEDAEPGDKRAPIDYAIIAKK